jgi:cell division protein FtsB
MSARGEAVRARPRARLTPRAAILAVLVVLLGMALAVPLRQLFEQRSEIAALEREVAALEERRDALERQVDRLHDPAYLEWIARTCLGMVRPGEISFVLPEDESPPRRDAC